MNLEAIAGQVWIPSAPRRAARMRIDSADDCQGHAQRDSAHAHSRATRRDWAATDAAVMSRLVILLIASSGDSIDGRFQKMKPVSITPRTCEGLRFVKPNVSPAV